MRAEAPTLCRRIGEAHGLEVDAEYLAEYPVTVTLGALFRLAALKVMSSISHLVIG